MTDNHTRISRYLIKRANSTTLTIHKPLATTIPDSRESVRPAGALIKGFGNKAPGPSTLHHHPDSKSPQNGEPTMGTVPVVMPESIAKSMPGPGREINITQATTPWAANMQEGIEIDITKLPPGVKTIRFYNSY